MKSTSWRRSGRRRIGLLETLRGEAGSIDLASIMTGVIVMGIIAGVIGAAAFAVIPWVQDESARTKLQSVGVAQAQAKARFGQYKPMAELVSAKLAQPSADITAVTNAADGVCYIAATQSESGNIFYQTSKNTDIKKYIAGTTEAATKSCAPFASIITELAAAVGAGAQPPLANNTPDRIADAQGTYFQEHGTYTNTLSDLNVEVVPGDTVALTTPFTHDLINEVDAADFEADPVARFSAGTPGTTFSWESGGSTPQGGHFVRALIPADAASSDSIILDGPGSPSVIDVTPGAAITYEATVRSSDWFMPKLQVIFYDADGTPFAPNAPSPSFATNPNDWTRIGAVIPAADVPAGAVSMSLQLAGNTGSMPEVVVDIESASVVSGIRSAPAADGSTVWDFSEWFQSKAPGYVSIVRTASGITYASTSEVPDRFQFFNNLWTPIADGPKNNRITRIAEGNNYPAILPSWARAAGWDDEDAWLKLRNEDWTIVEAR